ncbi:MAG: tRNA pseudouridine synthase A [Rhodospirillales bacterium]
MPRYRITVEYDGSNFVGWQRQSNGMSVQEALEIALQRLTGENPRVQGAGRTDAGVHAAGQVAHFDLEQPFPLKNLRDGSNFHLRPHLVTVIDVSEVCSSFDARFSAIRRRYRFRAVQCQAKSPVKTLEKLKVSRQGDEVLIDVEARSFLHNQVRITAGTLVLVGEGAWAPDDVGAALKAKNRAAAGPTAPPEGLCLMEVNYP